MEERIQWTNYKTKKILYLDYSNLNSRQLENAVKFIHLVEKTVLNSEKNLLILINFNEFFINDELLEILKNEFKNQSSYVKKYAVIHVTNSKVSIIQTLKDYSTSLINIFSDEESAKNWLVE